MTYFYDKKTNTLLVHDVDRDGETLRALGPLTLQVGELMGFPVLAAPAKEKRHYTKRVPKEGKEVQNDISEYYKNRGIGPEKTALIETALKNGISAHTVSETTRVSPATVYVIKTRLKKEGKLT